MTHNVWEYDGQAPAWEELGCNCSAPVRVKGIINVYDDTKPDIIGCQEASALMNDLLKEHFSHSDIDYTMIWGRFTPVFYRADKFDLLDSKFMSYPLNVPGYEGSFNNKNTKSYNIAVFRVKTSGEKFIFATTHLWWKKSPKEAGDEEKRNYQKFSDEAREYQLGLLIKEIDKFIEKYDCPAFLVGDLNTGYNSKAVSHAFESGYCHAHDIATDYADEAVGYHYCFPSGFEKFYSDAPFETAIDHILYKGTDKSVIKRFERYSPEYYYPISDHSAAFIDVLL